MILSLQFEQIILQLARVGQASWQLGVQDIQYPAIPDNWAQCVASTVWPSGDNVAVFNTSWAGMQGPGLRQTCMTGDVGDQYYSVVRYQPCILEHCQKKPQHTALRVHGG